MQLVGHLLIIGVRMASRDQTMLNASKILVQNLDHGSQTVGRTTGVGDAFVIGRQLIVVHASNHRQIVTLGRRRNDNLASAGT